MPDASPIEVQVGRVLEQTLTANAVGIHHEQVAVALVVKRVDDHGKAVIGDQRIALLQHAGADLTWILIEEESANI